MRVVNATVTADCPICGNEMEVVAWVAGGEADFPVPDGHGGCGPFTYEQQVGLSEAITASALEAVDALARREMKVTS